MSFVQGVINLLNGQIFSENESGETEVDLNTYTVPVRTTAPGAADANVYIADINDLNSAENAAHTFNELQTYTFLTDQIVFLREVCR